MLRLSIDDVIPSKVSVEESNEGCKRELIPSHLVFMLRQGLSYVVDYVVPRSFFFFIESETHQVQVQSVEVVLVLTELRSVVIRSDGHVVKEPSQLAFLCENERECKLFFEQWFDEAKLFLGVFVAQHILKVLIQYLHLPS